MQDKATAFILHFFRYWAVVFLFYHLFTFLYICKLSYEIEIHHSKILCCFPKLLVNRK